MVLLLLRTVEARMALPRLAIVTFALQDLSMTCADKLLTFNATFALSNATCDRYSVSGKGGKQKK